MPSTLHSLLGWTLAALATSAQAASFLPSTLPSVGAGTSIAGNCTSTGGDIATPQNLSNASTNLNAAIEQAGESITIAQNAQAAAFSKSLQALLDVQRQGLRNFIAAYEAAKYTTDTLGPNAQPTAAAANLPQGCNMSAMAQSAAAGFTAMSAQKQSIMQRVGQATAPVDSPAKAIASAAQASSAALSPSSILPDNQKPTDAASAAAYIAMAVAPFPPASVPANQLQTPGGVIAQAQINTWTARKNLAAEALSAVAQLHIPTVDATQAQSTWKAAGFSGPAPESSNGKISMNGLLQVLVDSRYANEQFYTALQSGGQAYALRSYAYELSAQLAIQQQQIAMLQRIVALNAAMLAQQTSALNGKMDELRAHAMSQSVNP